MSGELTVVPQPRKFTSLTEKCFLEDFGFPVHICLYNMLHIYMSRHLSFGIPIIKTAPKDDECYFCLTHIKSIAKHNNEHRFVIV